jgi:hypothetical protein
MHAPSADPTATNDSQTPAVYFRLLLALSVYLYTKQKSFLSTASLMYRLGYRACGCAECLCQGPPEGPRQYFCLRSVCVVWDDRLRAAYVVPDVLFTWAIHSFRSTWYDIPLWSIQYYPLLPLPSPHDCSKISKARGRLVHRPHHYICHSSDVADILPRNQAPCALRYLYPRSR